MTIDGLYAKLNYFSGKDKRGKTFKITEFNTLLPTVQDSLYSKELDDLVKSDLMNIPESRLSISPLRVFKAQNDLTIDDGIFPLPTDYRRYVSVSAGYREIEVKTENQFNRIRTSVFRRPIVMPICYFNATDIIICPNNVGSTILLYLRNPTVPYYDYCQDYDTLNEIFMPVGSTIVSNQIATDQLTLLSADGDILGANVTKSGVTATVHNAVTVEYTSITTELEWEAIYHDNLVLAMLSLVGINLDKSDLVQYSELKQREQG